MEQIPLSVTRRQGAGKSLARKLRAAGSIPAIIYGSGREAESLSIALGDLEKLLRQVSGQTAFLSLLIDDEKPRMAVIREIQTDYLGKQPLHVDFYEVKADQELTLDVTIEFIGTPKGSEEGGLLDVQNHTVSVQGTVTSIPESLQLDVSELGIGDTIHASELELPQGVSLAIDEGVVIASCYIPAVSAEEVSEEELEEGEEAEGEKAEEAGGEQEGSGAEGE